MYMMNYQDIVNNGGGSRKKSNKKSSSNILKMVNRITYKNTPGSKQILRPRTPTPEMIGKTGTWKNFDNPIQVQYEEGEAATELEDNIEDYFEGLNITKRIENLKDMISGVKKSAIDSKCVRNVSNWANTKSVYKFDKPNFNAEYTKTNMQFNSPKLAYILEHIKKLDEEDEKKHGRKFKHFIFSDIKGSEGAKVIASALISDGYKLGYDIKKNNDKVVITVKSNNDLNLTKGQNFLLLSSAAMYGKPIRVDMKKKILALFNSRPDNVYGDLARIIVMDSGFKEGIDLFDIKYIHIFEPQVNMSDQKQVIGRGTRTCGQKGLKFNPRSGWPLHVFKYDLSISEKYRTDFHGADSAFNYYLQSKNIDIRLVNLASNLENVVIKGSVDYKLNKPIHRFSVEDDDEEDMRGGAGDDDDDDDDDEEEVVHAEERLREQLNKDSAPGKKYKAVKKYIKKYFGEYKWPPVKMENLCGYEGPRSLQLLPSPETKGGAPKLITLSPTQDFISNYFSAANPLKGMVLWQSVGTGKTCTAIATATRQFEPLGYTILWVTRTTLKSDIWKNMFDMVCHEDIRDKVNAGVDIPDDMPSKMRLLSKSWSIRPISYKQFSNLVSKNNMYYEKLVKRNGAEDPLRKTLLIIDEAHKLYGGGDLSTIERPDMVEFHKALMNSYAVSGKDSVRVLFMTATPITQDPLELVKLVNLCKPIEKQIPAEFNDFADKYLDDTGDFTKTGKKIFLDDIAGHISYLNREGDVRQFAHPILTEIDVPLLTREIKNLVKKFAVVGATTENKEFLDLKSKADKLKAIYQKELIEYTEGNVQKINKVCNDYKDPDEFNQCLKLAKKHANKMIKSVKDQTSEMRKTVSNIGKTIRGRKVTLKDKMISTRHNRANDPDGYDKYKKTPYYKLMKCDKKWKDYPSFKKLLEVHPAYSEAIDIENQIKQDIEHVQTQFNAKVASIQSSIKSYSKLLKTPLEPIEAQVVRRSIADARNTLRNTKKYNKTWMLRLNTRAKMSFKNISAYKRKLKREIRKTVRQQLTIEKQIKKEQDKEIKHLQMADEDLSDSFKENVEIAKENVKLDMQTISEKIAKKINAATRKREIAERKIANATRKQHLALEKEQKKAEKLAETQRKKAEKLAETQRKKAEKLAETQRKKAEKVAEAERKKAEKAAAKKK
jgi:hypothetical protein